MRSPSLKVTLLSGLAALALSLPSAGHAAPTDASARPLGVLIDPEAAPPVAPSPPRASSAEEAPGPRPLGVLIETTGSQEPPGSSRPPPRSVDRPRSFVPSAPPPTTVPDVPGQTGSRPLGLLLDAPAPAPSPPAARPLPKTAPSPLTAAPAPPTSSAPEVPGQTGRRPLGVLLDAPAPAPDAPARAPAPNQTPEPVSDRIARPVAPSPSLPGRSGERPLGVLIEGEKSGTPEGKGSSPARADARAGQTAPASAPNGQEERDRAQPEKSATAPNSETSSGSPGQNGDRPLGLLLDGPGSQPGVPFYTTNVGDPLLGPAAAPGAPQERRLSVPQTDGDPPVNLKADLITFNQDTGVVTASGRVEATHDGRTLLAERLTYNQNTDVITALGNVALLEPDSETLLADELQITGDFKDGIVRNVGIILADRSRVAGAGARRSGGQITDLTKGVYSACNLCAEDPDAPPLWQVKAVRVKHDKRTKTIEYLYATLEVAGIPVFFTPYFLHPDPSVKRQSGLLTPSFGTSSDLGTVFTVPYFQSFSESSDLTVRPTYTSSEGFLFAGEYRQKLKFGEFDFTGSFINDNDGVNRGHIFTRGDFDLSDVWRVGFDLNRATDDTFLRIFGFESPAVLESRVFAEAFLGNSYFSIDALSFQDLRPDAGPLDSPNIFPEINYNYLGERDRLGGQLAVDANILILGRRDEGNDTRRFSVRPTWTRNFEDENGGAYTFSTGIYADVFNVSGLEVEGEAFSGTETRLFPFAALNWRLPLIRPSETITQVLEPIVEVVVSPNGGNPSEIPNEDSQEFEFDDSNVFGVNRFGGLDLVEGGLRTNYGLRWSLFGPQGWNAVFFAGQTFRVQDDDTFAAGSGLEEKSSDIVASARIDAGDFVDLSYRTQVDKNNFGFNRNELAASIGVPLFRLTTSYLFFEAASDSEFGDREDVTFDVRSQLSQRWRFGFNAVQDLSENELRSLRWDLAFENECCTASARFARTFFEDRDVEPTDSITFNIFLKTLGGFGS